MNPETIENNIATGTLESGALVWQNPRKEIETEWHTALHGEPSDVVPSKLPVSQPPIRRAV